MTDKTSDTPLTVSDYDEVLADHRRLVREIDVIINGEDGAAKQASLCDLIGQIRSLAAAEPLLDEIEEFLEQQSDVVDGSYGEPRPNKAMSLLTELQRIRYLNSK